MFEILCVEMILWSSDCKLQSGFAQISKGSQIGAQCLPQSEEQQKGGCVGYISSSCSCPLTLMGSCS